VVASDTFVWPAEPLGLPDLEGFGVVRVRLYGVGGGFVVSYGQTPEIALGPGEALEISVLFAPVNRALPLSAPMRAVRSEATSVTLRDGRVLIAGGYAAQRAEVLTSVELYDPSTGLFGDAPYSLPVPLAATQVAEFDSGERIFVGGITHESGTPSAESVLFVEESGTMESVRPMSRARAGHCLSQFSGDRAMVFGGHADDLARGDYLRVNIDDGAWNFTEQPFDDLDDSSEELGFEARHLNGCLRRRLRFLARRFLQGPLERGCLLTAPKRIVMAMADTPKRATRS